ncbi:hypothetical protein CLV91_2725 [Maribacter vaceletii]|uniref:Uncharacterized protein n=1 Tax=Maribacter vaceletii TaxID=1206816 RepID=A0A495DU02_9FLAO|nr:hypothetical protein [Maribacter vaceletii]RKR07963.1 hypothetical protein CLV91_2725 [Maribacter vaceletii]
MVYLNYNNLDEETQQHLLSVSKKEVERKFGEDLKVYAKENHIEYTTILYEEAVKNLYSYHYIFNI